MKATKVLDNIGDRAVQHVYKLEPPMGDAEFVVVSACNVMFSGPETYIFKSTETGEILDWTEMNGSFKGGLDHDRALRNAGYEVV